MLQITVTHKGQSKAKQIPANLQQLNWSRYLKAVKATRAETVKENAVLSALTDIPQTAIGNMRPEHYNLMVNLCSFFWSDEPQIMEAIPDEVAAVEIGLMSWEDMINARRSLKTASESKVTEYHAGAEIVRIYTGIEITDETPTAKALPLVNFFLEQFENWSKTYEALSKDEPDENEIAAGIDNINAFEHFATLDTLCSGNPLLYDDMLRVEAVNIYTKLLLNKTTNDYATKLREYQDFTDNQTETHQTAEA